MAEAEAEVALRREEVLKARAKQGASKWSTPGIDEDKERIESGKAAAIAVATGEGELASKDISLGHFEICTDCTAEVS